MMDRICLNGEWEIVERPLSDGPEMMTTVLEEKATLTGHVPGDVSDNLVQSGQLPEPLVGMNFNEFKWVQERSWWFRKSFVVPATWQDACFVELSLDGLDIHGDIWLNGTHLGHQKSAFYPFEKEVQSLLIPGKENVVLVRLTTGRERPPEDCDFPLLGNVPTEEGRGYPDRGFKKRIYLRKPAYTWGWDWGPQLATCGITGNAELRCHKTSEIGDVCLRTTLADDTAVVHATVEILHHTLTASTWATLSLELEDEDGEQFVAVSEDVFIASGRSVHKMTLRIPQARLWWPNGAGEQHRYTVRAFAEMDGDTAEKAPFLHGLRTVEMVVKPGEFLFKINGQPIFMKGGNWIPCDSLYGRIPAERVTKLVEEAAEANFNVLRIWGGGRFEMDAFYDACDRLGVMVWQDFMSACAPLPAHEPWFCEEFRKEADYQVRRLRNRACLLLWCGNNEVGGCYHWFPFETKDPGWYLYHEMLPQLVDDLCPNIPYWPTSPYGGSENVGDATVGDDHHWVVMSPEEKFWSHPEYWDESERPIFNSEYGYGGPCCLESTRQYLGFEPDNLAGDVAHEHTNSFYNIPRVNFSIKEHYRDPEGISLQEYILYGGLCQGLNLGYSLESLRANNHSMGGIFWMYDDTWGENGWTIIDYYLRRKVSYYNVKRCLAPKRLVLRRGGQAFGGQENEVVLLGINESTRPIEASIRFGYLSNDGKTDDTKTVNVTLPPRSREVLASCPCPTRAKSAKGTVIAQPDESSGLETSSWRQGRYRDLQPGPAHVSIVSVAPDGNDLKVQVQTDQYAHAVHFDISGDIRLSDHYFDLLPDEVKTITLYDASDLDPNALTVTCVNAER